MLYGYAVNTILKFTPENFSYEFFLTELGKDIEYKLSITPILEKKEIQKAREIKEAFEKSSEREIHGFMHEKYGFIDEPIYRDALNTLESVKS